MSCERILSKVRQLGAELVEITGGEPLLQSGSRTLARELCDGDSVVLLETNGERDISGIDPRVHRIMDLKAPSSGESERMRWENLKLLTLYDEIKIVLLDRVDYEWARETIASRKLVELVKEVLLSCVHGKLEPRELASWVLQDRLPVRVQLQLHKYIWGADAVDV